MTRPRSIGDERGCVGMSKPVLALALSLTLAVACSASPADSSEQSWRDYESVDDFPVYEARVDSGGTLYWFGNAFEPPIEFRLHGVELWINGIKVPHSDVGATPTNTALIRSMRRNPDPVEQLHDKASGARSFNEWVAFYRESALVDSVATCGDSAAIQVRWADAPAMGFGAVLYHPRGSRRPERALPWVNLRASLTRIVDLLRRGNNMWCHGFLYTAALKEPIHEAIEALPSYTAKYYFDPLPLDAHREEDGS